MSPRAADPGVRMALLETAARIIATEGLGKLTLRRLAHEVGTSTMAIYTHFGGMTELRREIRREGFARLGAREAAVAITGDPVSDLWALGAAYYSNAIENPNLYQAMFMDGPVDEADAGVGLETFDQLVTAVQRCIDAGRFDPADPVGLATQLWALVHGLVTLELARLLPPDRVLACLDAGARNLMTAFGDDPRAVAPSIAAATKGAPTLRRSLVTLPEA
ncbi:MAG: TetR/AcrR family transcriptional regulator [Acidimicrobiales bacterium]